MASKLTFAREDREFKILRLLEKAPDLTQREIATRLGLSLGALNYCVRSLADRGFIKIRNFSESDNKLGYAYLLTPRGLKEKAYLTSRFLHRKLVEYENLRHEIDELNAESGTALRTRKSEL